MIDDLELLREYAARGSEEAFRTVVDRYVGLVHGAAFRQVGDAYAAEEITQAVFVVLARKAGSLRSGTVLSGWLFRTTRFLATRSVRNEARRQRREQEAARMEPYPSPTPNVLWDEIAPSLDDALAQLGEADRLAILLRYFQQRELKEIGRALGSSENAATKRLTRALEKMRDYFVRRGAVLTTAMLAGILTQNAAQAAPAGLAASTLAAVTAQAGTPAILALVKAALKSMFYTKVWGAGMASAAVLVVVGAGTLLAQKSGEPGLPTKPGETFTIEIPGLPPGAKKLEFVVIPGRGKIQPFLLGKYEVTQGQYVAVRHTNFSTFQKGPDYPVEQMSWQDAKDFCAALQLVLPAALQAKCKIRLPTDDEWSIAAGLPEEPGRDPEAKSGKIKRVFPWGTEWPPPTNAGNYSDKTSQALLGTPLVPGAHDGFADTSPVGSYPPNPFGVYDLGGNVWEWVEDWLGDEMNVRVVRGAAFFTTSESQIISSYRGRPPILRNYASGFRVLLEVNP